MNYKVLLSISMMLYYSSIIAMGQTVKCNFLLCNEDTTACYHKTTNIDVGKSGEDVVWDYHYLSISDDCKHFYTLCIDDTTSIVTGEKENNLCLLQNAGLYILKSASHLKRMDYQKQPLLLPSTLSYGDSVYNEFEGKGWYSDSRAMEEEGDMTAVADAYGTLIFPDGDTLTNVLRIHTIRNADIGIEPDTVFRKDSPRKQMVTEKYLWYASGCRFPVLISSSQSCFDNGQLLTREEDAYVLCPEFAKKTKPARQDVEPSLRDSEAMIHYTVEVHDKVITLRYDLLEDCSVKAIVANVAGIVYREKQLSGDSGISNECVIDCGGLHSGEYVLYINVNGQVFQQKVKL